MISNTKRPSLVWTLFLVFLMTTQISDTEAGVSLKLKKILKRVLLLKALVGKKGISIIPIPIPLNLFMKDKMDAMKMEKMPEPMPYPMYMPMGSDKMMGYEMMMPKESDMPHQGGMMMGSGKYGMMMQSGKYGMMGGD